MPTNDLFRGLLHLDDTWWFGQKASASDESHIQDNEGLPHIQTSQLHEQPEY